MLVIQSTQKTKQGYKQIKQGIRRELFANNEHYLTLQRQNASGTVKYNPPRDGADNQIWIIGTGPRDQGAGGDAPQVDHHVVGREYQACLHVRPAFPMFGYEQQTTGIGNQCDECDSHHHQRFRLTTEYKASHHLYEHAHSQDQLQYTSKMRGTYLHFHAMSNRIKGKPVHRRIGKIVQGFSNQAGGLGDQTGSHFHYEQKCIDAEQPAQGPGFLLSRSCRKLGGLDGLWICSDGFLKRGA